LSCLNQPSHSHLASARWRLEQADASNRFNGLAGKPLKRLGSKPKLTLTTSLKRGVNETAFASRLLSTTLLGTLLNLL
jgi:hypothetical protein